MHHGFFWCLHVYFSVYESIYSSTLLLFSRTLLNLSFFTSWRFKIREIARLIFLWKLMIFVFLATISLVYSVHHRRSQSHVSWAFQTNDHRTIAINMELIYVAMEKFRESLCIYVYSLLQADRNRCGQRSNETDNRVHFGSSSTMTCVICAAIAFVNLNDTCIHFAPLNSNFKRL